MARLRIRSPTSSAVAAAVARQLSISQAAAICRRSGRDPLLWAACTARGGLGARSACRVEVCSTVSAPQADGVSDCLSGFTSRPVAAGGPTVVATIDQAASAVMLASSIRTMPRRSRSATGWPAGGGSRSLSEANGPAPGPDRPASSPVPVDGGAPRTRRMISASACASPMSDFSPDGVP